MKDVLKFLSIIGLIILFIFIAPLIFFWVAYFGGWIAKITIGGYLVNGLELLGINISIDDIPLIAGTFGWVGGFFKSIATGYQKNND